MMTGSAAMKIRVSVADSTIDKPVDVPLKIRAVADTGTVEQITVSGLPDSASLSAGTRKNDGSWELKSTDLPDLRITWRGEPVNLEVKARGTADGTATSGSATARIAVRSAAASNGTYGMLWTALAQLTVTVAVFICWRMLFANALELLAKDWCAP